MLTLGTQGLVGLVSGNDEIIAGTRGHIYGGITFNGGVMAKTPLPLVPARPSLHSFHVSGRLL